MDKTPVLCPSPIRIWSDISNLTSNFVPRPCGFEMVGMKPPISVPIRLNYTAADVS
jgi:hypothetical protein